jgi:nucleotide-binding universal stress UspA family protein
MSKIIVGVDQSEGSNDAITLASSLAGITGAELMLVNVFPYDQRPSRAVNAAFEAYLRKDSLELLERLRGSLDASVEVKAVANHSPAHGLHDLAEAEDAALIVVGSTHTGRAGRVLPGSTAERLLHGSPCPVAVAPKGYRERSDTQPAIIGCGYDGSASSQRALEAARRVAAVTGAQLQVIRAFEPLMYDLPPGNAAFGGMSTYNDALLVRATEELDAAVARIETDGAEPHITMGDAVRVLTDASEELDLLLVGSRGYGPMHAVLVGGVAGRLVTEAACPVIVFPRSAGHTEDDSLFAKTAVLRG